MRLALVALLAVMSCDAACEAVPCTPRQGANLCACGGRFCTSCQCYASGCELTGTPTGRVVLVDCQTREFEAICAEMQ